MSAVQHTLKICSEALRLDWKEQAMDADRETELESLRRELAEVRQRELAVRHGSGTVDRCAAISLDLPVAASCLPAFGLTTPELGAGPKARTRTRRTVHREEWTPEQVRLMILI